MKYGSTRGGVRGLTFEQALLSGYAADGGILLPETVPRLNDQQLRDWSQLSYSQLVLEIASLFISESEIPRVDLKRLLDKAFTCFSLPSVVHLSRLKDDLNILELFHGPTLAFKDLALSCVGQFIEYFLQKQKKHVTIVVGTSGDTGSAAIESVRGLKWVDIVVLLPKGRCSKVQELQMTTVIEDNVHIYRVDGSSDDLDAPIKRCFADPDFVARHNLCSINSINWARVMVQIAHYFYAYFQLCATCDEEVEIAVPTGACGNITGGLIAREMGLPAKFVCCVNVNDIVARTINNGDFSVNGDVIQSHASAMDIQVPYNMERIWYLLSGGDGARIKTIMDKFEANNNKVTVPKDLLEKMQETLSSFCVTDAEIEQTMRKCFHDNQYMLCPHTATAAKYHYEKLKDNGNVKRVCIATASPLKFEEAVLSAELTLQPTDKILALYKKPTNYIDLNQSDNWYAILRNKIESISGGS